MNAVHHGGQVDKRKDIRKYGCDMAIDTYIITSRIPSATYLLIIWPRSAWPVVVNLQRGILIPFLFSSWNYAPQWTCEKKSSMSHIKAALETCTGAHAV